MGSEVFGVHAIRSEEIAATALLCSTLRKAEQYAEDLSTDPGVLGAAITKYVLDQQGHRTAVALFVSGRRQAVPWISDDRAVLANGWPPNRAVK
ncbi:hypothetical protein GCM10023321_61700 [Pseudonocardia eucalypti]|uniref:Uncharacterized protein n=1 Tax=Pseudonocardia eucalypti TaxID=648755 RepID=A0ABP9QV89_9PSEU